MLVLLTSGAMPILKMGMVLWFDSNWSLFHAHLGVGMAP